MLNPQGMRGTVVAAALSPGPGDTSAMDELRTTAMELVKMQNAFKIVFRHAL